jgi:hypothetical protein
MSKTLLAAVVAAAVCVPAVRAADTSNVSLSSDHRMTTAMHPVASGDASQSYAIPKGLKPLFNNIGIDYPKGRYIASQGWTISGPASIIGQQFWIGAQFTPKASGMVNEVDVAVGYVTGTMGVTVSLYTDAGGVPGTLLGSFKAKHLPTFGSCCRVERAFSGVGTPVTGGDPYWVTVTTDDATADEWAAWNSNDVDQVDPITAAANDGAGWAPTQLLPAPSFAVIGS